MGDTGSLTIGLLLAILTIKFNELNALQITPFQMHSAPSVSIGILFLPLFDTLRVTIIRLSQGLNPFHGDNNHLHHRLLRLGLNHRKATLVLVILNAFFIVLSFLFDQLGILTLGLILLAVAVFFSNFSFWLEQKRFQANNLSKSMNENGYYLDQSILKNNKLPVRLRA
jgi:hypothetical protein